MIPFKNLQVLADKIRDKTGAACAVSVDHFAYSATPTNESHSNLSYGLYLAGTLVGTVNYDTLDDLKDAMHKIINPSEDEGVSVGEATNDG